MAAASAALSGIALGGFSDSGDSDDEGQLVGSGTRRRVAIRRGDEYTIVVAKSTHAKGCAHGAFTGNCRLKLYLWLGIGMVTEGSAIVCAKAQCSSFILIGTKLFQGKDRCE